MWLAVIDAKSLSVAASASVDGAIFPAKTRTLQRCAALFARGSLLPASRQALYVAPTRLPETVPAACWHSPAVALVAASALHQLTRCATLAALLITPNMTATKLCCRADEQHINEAVASRISLHGRRIVCPCWLGLLVYYPNPTRPCSSPHVVPIHSINAQVVHSELAPFRSFYRVALNATRSFLSQSHPSVRHMRVLRQNERKFCRHSYTI